MSTAMEDEATISIPSIAFVAVLGFILYRYFWSSSSSSNSTSSTSTTSSSRTSSSAQAYRFTAAQVDQISSMFPQLNRRDIMWDLHRNRGNVQATTERVISTGRLESAPQSFNPSIPTTPTTRPLGAAGGSGVPVTTAKTTVEPDLITRYNLKARVDDTKGKEKAEPNSGWSSSKDERQALLHRRRDEMILAARRKMQEKDARSRNTVGVGGPDGATAAVVDNATSANVTSS